MWSLLGRIICAPLACTTVVDKGVFGDCFNNIIGHFQHFWKFWHFSMPVPVKDAKVPDDNWPNMVACYNLEANLIAVNLYQMKCVLLSKKELDHHSSPLHHYCEVQSPVYSINSSKLWIVVLFLKGEERIQKSSQSIVAPNSILPQASHVTDGLRFVATQTVMTFTVVCPQKRKENHTCEPTNHYDEIECFLHCHKRLLNLTFILSRE